MNSKLTKEAVLKGAQKRETIHLDALGGSLTIRPLTDGELSEIRSIALKGMSDEAIRAIPRLQAIAAKRGSIDDLPLTGDDLMQAQRNDSEGNVMAAAYGLSCDGESWNTEEVRGLPVGVPELIAKAVFALSGIGEAADLSAGNFRQDERGDGDTDPA